MAQRTLPEATRAFKRLRKNGKTSMQILREQNRSEGLGVRTAGKGRTIEVVAREIEDRLKRKRDNQDEHKVLNILSSFRPWAGLTEQARENIRNLDSDAQSVYARDLERVSTWDGDDELIRSVRYKISDHVIELISRNIETGHRPSSESHPVPIAEQNPLFLLDLNVEFRRIDALAIRNGWWDRDSNMRVDAFVWESVRELINRAGDTWVPCRSYRTSTLVKSTSEPLPPEMRLLDERAEHMLQCGKLIRDGDLVTMAEYYHAAQSINEVVQGRSNNGRLASLAAKHPMSPILVRQQNAGEPPPPTKQQQAAFDAFETEGLILLAGAGGTGKTDVCIRGMVERSLVLGCNVCLCAPTHAVRKRLKAFVGCYGECVDVCVIQRLNLQWETNATELAPIVYILDEASMVGTKDISMLCERFLDSPSGSKLVLCGDPDQLRPISPGQPFADIVQYFRDRGDPRLCALTRVFRAEAASLAEFAALYRSQMPGVPQREWTLDPARADRFQADEVTMVFQNEMNGIKRAFRDACKLKKDEGVSEDELLIVTHQNATCKKLHEIKRHVYRGIAVEDNFAYCPGDRVVFCTNTPFYKNGDAGDVCAVDSNNTTTIITVEYTPVDADEIRALKLQEKKRNSKYYKTRDVGGGKWHITVRETPRCSAVVPGGCVTVHKAQGGQSNHVIVVAIPTPYPQKSDWMYTSVSRCKQSQVLIGPLSAFNFHARPDKNPQRNTVLRTLLRRPLMGTP